jgi:hypothetical protein
VKYSGFNPLEQNMDIKPEYDFSHLSMKFLHSIGVRSTSEIKEVVESKLSLCEEGADIFEYDVYIITGLTLSCKGLKIALTISEEGKYVILELQIPSPKELLAKLCPSRK